MKYAYFPGCSASSTGVSYTLSYNYVAQCTGIEMEEIPDWNCCGATAAHVESHDLSDALSARSLALSEAAYGDMPVLAPCAGCYLHLKTAVAHARENEETRERIEGLIQKPWNASADVANGLEPFLDEEVRERTKNHVCRPLAGLKVASYYGCTLLRPTEITQFDDDEQPHTMEDLLALTGATPIDWAFKNECCGASHQISIPAAGRTMVRRILENAEANGADAIACACPLCVLNLDMREAEVNAARAKEGKEPLDIPIYYFTELLGASFGANVNKIGLNRHFHPAANVYERARASWEEDQAKAAAEAAANPPRKRPRGKAPAKAPSIDKAMAVRAAAEAEAQAKAAAKAKADAAKAAKAAADKEVTA